MFYMNHCHRCGMSDREKGIRGWICIALACLVIGLSVRSSSNGHAATTPADQVTPGATEFVAP